MTEYSVCGGRTDAESEGGVEHARPPSEPRSGSGLPMEVEGEGGVRIRLFKEEGIGEVARGLPMSADGDDEVWGTA